MRKFDPKEDFKLSRIIALLIFIIFAIIGGNIDCNAMDVAGGLRYNNGGVHGIFGIVKTITPRITEFVALDAGGDAGAFSALTMFRIKTFGKFTVHTILGPTVEFIDEDPEFNVIRSVLIMSTGALLNFQLDSESSFWLGGNYMINRDDIKQFKFGIGYTTTIDLL